MEWGSRKPPPAWIGLAALGALAACTSGAVEVPSAGPSSAAEVGSQAPTVADESPEPAAVDPGRATATTPAAPVTPTSASTTLPGDPWDRVADVVLDDGFAELVARTGDIDNLGFGWPPGFDPFAGGATPVHDWWIEPEADDPAGTDRIMVVSGFDFADLDRELGVDGVLFDGYSTIADQTASDPTAIVLEWDPIAVESAAIQLFVDDLESPFFGTDLEVTLDGRSARNLSAFVSGVDQSGPIGRLVTVGLLPEFLDLLDDGRLQIRIDGPNHSGGDGFAIDFAQIVINPTGWRYSGSVSGVVIDAETGAPVPGVLVSATNLVESVTDESGVFELDGVPAGRVVLSAARSGFATTAVQLDLEDAGALADVTVALPEVREDIDRILAALDSDGSVDLYGVLFASGEATITEDSTFVLAEVLGAIFADPDRSIVIVGHTDDVGTDEYNLDLSTRRAQAVVDWLVGAGLPDGVATAEGRGESEPIADNATEEGRALNRRVELRVVS